MRIEFQREIESLRTDLADMCGIAGSAVGRATRAVLESDCGSARATAVDACRLTAMRETTEGKATSLLALQSPVAGDLRVVVAAIRIAADATRMGQLARHIAECCLRHEPTHAVPAELRSTYTAMGVLAVGVAERCQVAVRTGHCAEVDHIYAADRDMERLHRNIFEIVSAPAWEHRPAVAADMVLLGRFYGRFADLAVDVARQVRFQSTGRRDLTGSMPA